MTRPWNVEGSARRGVSWWLYRRLGRAYPTIFLTTVFAWVLPVAIVAVSLLALYVDVEPVRFGGFALWVLAVTLVGVAATVWDAHRRLAVVRRWIGGERDPTTTQAAWRAAVGLPMAVVSPRIWPRPVSAVVAIAIGGRLVLDLDWVEVLFVAAASVVAVGYVAVLDHITAERGLWPVVVDIARHLPAGFHLERSPRSLRTKLLLSLPIVNVITGVVVAGISSPERELSALGLDVVIAIGVTFVLTIAVTARLAASVVEPLRDLLEAAQRVGSGDLDVQVPVTTADETGAVGFAFNGMVRGLAERERIRAALGTYLDADVAAHILGGGDSEGQEFEVTVLFLDIRGFTGLAETRAAAELVATLNGLFEVAVPLIHAEGGYVDKFVGDGLLAVFGAPRRVADHAERALAAACAIAAAVEASFGHDLAVGIGLNSGTVIAGNVGGGGRLDFSVIGDAVNVAARVEEATRRTGDAVLLTEATAAQLPATTRDRLVARDAVPLRGRSEPVRLLAPSP